MPRSLLDQDQLLIFECDFSAYHLQFVRDGIRNYFENGRHALSFVNMGIAGLIQLFGPQVTERVMAIGYLRSQKAIDYLANLSIPCMNLIDWGTSTALCFGVRFEGEGTLAGRYFFEEMKLENVGFIGNTPSEMHDRRLREFSHLAERRGIRIDAVHLPLGRVQRPFCDIEPESIECRKESIRGLLLRLRKPAGIFCGDDQIALQTYYCAELLNIRVPEEVSILGVGSRDLTKDSWARTVSVVQLDHQRLGYVAAQLMDAYVSTGKAPSPIWIRPSGICHSQTTFRRNVGDAVVKKALLRIRETPAISVSALCLACGYSRAALDVRFRRSTNMTIAQAIELERFEQAKNLISRFDYNLESIASLAGFPSCPAMRRSFYRFSEMSPQQYRKFNVQQTRNLQTEGQVK